MSDYFDRVNDQLRASIRRRAHLPWYLRLRVLVGRRRGLLVAAATAVVVAGPALAAAGLFDSGISVSSASCQVGSTVACVYGLSDGRRFSCPGSFARAEQTPGSLEHAKACTNLPPLVVPAAWRPVLSAITKTRSCLATHGVRVNGGSDLGVPSAGPKGLVGELVTMNGRTSALIVFYESSRLAEQRESSVIHNLKRVGGEVTRRGAVIIAWTRSGSREQRTTLERCTFG